MERIEKYDEMLRIKKVNINLWNGSYYTSVIRHSGDSRSLLHTRVAGFRWKFLCMLR